MLFDYASNFNNEQDTSSTIYERSIRDPQIVQDGDPYRSGWLKTQIRRSDWLAPGGYKK